MVFSFYKMYNFLRFYIILKGRQRNTNKFIYNILSTFGFLTTTTVQKQFFSQNSFYCKIPHVWLLLKETTGKIE